MNRLVLLDGNAILHRAYHALPPLTAPDGSIVNAVYGFTSILLKTFHELKPTHMAVAFDRKAPTFRKEIYKEYQATRPKMDEDLIPQIEKVHGLVRAFGLSIYELDGYEADDVIGTITYKSKVKSQKSKASFDEIIIVTGDRDLLQLVGGHVKAFMPTKGVSEGKLYGEAETKERLGIFPKQIPDYKALAGDASDNYPGIAGIGPKTAVDLLTEFGSLEKLLTAVKKNDSHFDKLPQKLQEKLAGGIEDALMSHNLATIRTNVPITVDFEKTKVITLDTLEARAKLEELHFFSLLNRLMGVEKQERKRKQSKKEQPEEKKEEQEQLALV